MGLNLSNAQIAKELELNESDCHAMTSALRAEVFEKRPQVQLEGAVEFDELSNRAELNDTRFKFNLLIINIMRLATIDY